MSKTRKAQPLRVRVTMVFDDPMRRALNHHYGLPGKASAAHCKLWMETTLGSTWPDLASEYSRDTGDDAD